MGSAVMDQNDYDEFGNYVGPELDDDSDGEVSNDGAGAEVRALLCAVTWPNRSPALRRQQKRTEIMVLENVLARGGATARDARDPGVMSTKRETQASASGPSTRLDDHRR